MPGIPHDRLSFFVGTTIVLSSPDHFLVFPLHFGEVVVHFVGDRYARVSAPIVHLLLFEASMTLGSSDPHVDFVDIILVHF